jgi:hypothetical protein
MNNGSNNYYMSNKNAKGQPTKADNNNMMEVLLKNPSNDPKLANGHFNSTPNSSAPAGGLPGVRGRVRQSNGSKNNSFSDSSKIK